MPVFLLPRLFSWIYYGNNKGRTVAKPFSERVVAEIKAVPRGRVATYGQIARRAGNSRAARQVSYILHSSSRKEQLPWHRVINSKGGISLKKGYGYERQKQLLIDEGIIFDKDDLIDLKRFGIEAGK
jgi:methylated-DNA-protein-cysteine methyltransferase-like protein